MYLILSSLQIKLTITKKNTVKHIPFAVDVGADGVDFDYFGSGFWFHCQLYLGCLV